MAIAKSKIALISQLSLPHRPHTGIVQVFRQVNIDDEGVHNEVANDQVVAKLRETPESQ